MKKKKAKSAARPVKSKAAAKRKPAKRKKSETQELLDFAIEMAYEAGALTLRYYGGLVDADDKSDGSPVTIADRKAEELIRKRVAKKYPAHGVLGEEYGESNAGARVRWILDPIDGTRSFMHGVPLYGVLIGIEADGEPIVGVTYFPPLDEMVSAGKGLGCKWNGKPCRVSTVSQMSQAVVCTTDVERLLKRSEGPGWRRLQQRAAHAAAEPGRAGVAERCVVAQPGVLPGPPGDRVGPPQEVLAPAPAFLLDAQPFAAAPQRLALGRQPHRVTEGLIAGVKADLVAALVDARHQRGDPGLVEPVGPVEPRVA